MQSHPALATRRSQNHTTTQAGKDLKSHRVQQLIQHCQVHHYTQLIHGEAFLSGCCGCPIPGKCPKVSLDRAWSHLVQSCPRCPCPWQGELNSIIFIFHSNPIVCFPALLKAFQPVLGTSIRFCFGLYPCLGLRHSSQGHALQGKWQLEGALWGATTSICPFQAVLLQHPAFLLLLGLQGSLCSPQAAGAQQG